MVKRIGGKVLWWYRYFKGQEGVCPICENEVRFIINGAYLRNHYRCSNCNSIPRSRALIDTLRTFYPEWETLTIHESSPNNGPSSTLLRQKCKYYSSSQYFADVPRGQFKNGHRSEDLSALTFDDNKFDLLITQDVFEHVMEPEKAFREIARVLKPGGAHVFSMPWYSHLKKSRQRAKVVNGDLVYLEEPVYHGNPIDKEKGALVTFDWGQDFIDIIYKASGMNTVIYLQKDRRKGLEGDFLEIFISRKPATS